MKKETLKEVTSELEDQHQGVDTENIIYFCIISFFIICTIYLFVGAYKPVIPFSEDNVLYESGALRCLESTTNSNYDKDCVGKSLKLTAFLASHRFSNDEYSFNTRIFGDRASNFIIPSDDLSLKGDKFEIKGVFEEKGWLSFSPKITSLTITSIPLDNGETTSLDYKRNGESYRKQSIADAYKSRDNFDAIVRDNTSTRRKALKAAAVNVTTHNTGGSVMSTGYTMKDGSLIICTTKVLPSAPAVMECDGNP